MKLKKVYNHKPKTKLFPITIRIPIESWRRAVRMAKIRNMSFNKFITFLIEN